MIIALANQKGGVAKTHTAAALACGLNRSGKKTLAVDIDPQGSLSYLLGAEPDAPGLPELLQGKATQAAAIQHTEQADIISANSMLVAIEKDMKADALRQILRPIKKYKHVVIDTGPGLSKLLIAGLTAAELVIIPAKANAGSLQGIIETYNTLAALPGKRRCAVLFTAIHGRQTNAEQSFIEAIRKTCESLGVPVLNTIIGYGEAAITSGEAYRECILQYDPKSKPALDYMALLSELQL